MAGQDERPLTRRRVLVAGAGGAAVAAGAALTGCGSGGKPGASDAAVLTPLDKVPVGGATVTSGADGKPVIVVRPDPGSALAFSGVCTHLGCSVTQLGDQLFCPCHGSAFELRTGKVINGPANRTLPAVTVHVADGNVVTGKG